MCRTPEILKLRGQDAFFTKPNANTACHNMHNDRLQTGIAKRISS